MPKVSHRLDRIAELIQRQVALLFEKEINDPRVKGITLSHVKVSPDLSWATIYFTLLKEDNIAPVTRHLNHTASFLRRRLAEELDLRIVPRIRFHYDDKLREAQKVLNVISHLRDSNGDK